MVLMVPYMCPRLSMCVWNIVIGLLDRYVMNSYVYLPLCEYIYICASVNNQRLCILFLIDKNGIRRIENEYVGRRLLNYW